MSVRTLLVALVPAALLTGAVHVACARASDLTIVTPTASLQRAIESAYVQPFTVVTDTAVQQETFTGGLAILQAQATRPNDPWDLVMVGPDTLAAGCKSGLFQKLDWSAIGGKDHYLPEAVSDCGVGAVVSTTVLAWDKDKLPIAPTWSDFWDVAKYPGKRGLRRGVRGNLEFALLADGVAPADIYKTLSTPEGVDRAFRKLDQLKPYIVWWSTPSEAAHILTSGGVLMTSAPSGEIAMAGSQAHKHFGLQFAGSLHELESWAILKSSTSPAMAEQFLYFTGMPAIERNLLIQSGESGLVKGLNDKLPPELDAIAPGTEAHLKAGLPLDTGFWRANLAKLRARFDTWIGK